MTNLVVHDFEEDRLDIRNFVIDYFEHRISESGEEWYESPGLVDGVQEEHKAMRTVATIFEKRNKKEVDNMVQQILKDSTLAFPRFCDVLDEFGRTDNENTRQMPFGRLVGIIAFAGCLAAALIHNEQRREVQQVLLYTTTFIGARIRLSWAAENLSWKDFMVFACEISRRDEKKREREAIQEEQRRRSRRLSFGLAVGAVGVGAVALFVSSKYFR